MQRSDVVEQLKRYIAETMLDGEDIGLNESTPLLEWGVINSLELVGLLSFIQQQFHVEIPGEKVTAEHLANLAVLSELVVEQASGVRK
ncbi:MAG TPA: acyl carrier protein [Ktedonobacteraceae bacterium]|nr:acyl carrier protein [Ktedonobacteraceae bacterium]